MSILINDFSVGFVSCYSIRTVGHVSDVKLFFECVDVYFKPENESYLMERLYKRYVKTEDMYDTYDMVKRLKKQFSKIKTCLLYTSDAADES